MGCSSIGRANLPDYFAAAYRALRPGGLFLNHGIAETARAKRRLEAARDRAIAEAGEEVYRTWRLYLAGARVAFERGELDVAQLLLARPGPGAPAPRPLRPWW